MPDIYQKSGYLNSPFRLFYLEDLPGREYAYHYHDFHKLLIFLNGTVSYRVEGREYDLKPGDQVLIPAGEIHCPVVHPTNGARGVTLNEDGSVGSAKSEFLLRYREWHTA